jgi:hypothetical protein
VHPEDVHLVYCPEHELGCLPLPVRLVPREATSVSRAGGAHGPE